MTPGVIKISVHRNYFEKPHSCKPSIICRQKKCYIHIGSQSKHKFNNRVRKKLSLIPEASDPFGLLLKTSLNNSVKIFSTPKIIDEGIVFLRKKWLKCL